MRTAFGCFFVVLFVTCVSAQFTTFREVTEEAGINFTPADKTSSPTIADLNQDGFLDIVQCNHARRPVEIFYGSATGVFTKFEFFREKLDRHGTGIADVDGDGLLDIILSAGIAFTTRPRDPPMVARSVNGTIGNLELLDGMDLGLTPTAEQGPASRIAVRMVDLDADGDLDMFLFARPVVRNGAHHGIFEKLGNSMFRFDSSTGIERGPIQGSLVTDFNGDGLPDILQFNSGVRMFRNDGKGAFGFSFTDVTSTALPRRYNGRKFGGAAEFDYDNDGDFDIYLGGGVKVKFPFRESNDVLLRNNGDMTFTDRSRRARLPRGGAHMGITVADFDNNGFMDVFIPRPGPFDLRINDLILFNNGDQTFTTVEDHGANGPVDGSDQTSAVGAQAFDYDRDGLVDVVVASRLNPFDGKLRLFKNVGPSTGNYIIVQVPVNFNGATSMDAIIRVTTPQGVLTRKVGSVGESRTQSFIDQVHVGLGSATSVSLVTASFTNGIVLQVENPPINTLVLVEGG